MAAPTARGSDSGAISTAASWAYGRREDARSARKVAGQLDVGRPVRGRHLTADPGGHSRSVECAYRQVGVVGGHHRDHPDAHVEGGFEVGAPERSHFGYQVED